MLDEVHNDISPVPSKAIHRALYLTILHLIACEAEEPDACQSIN